MKPFAFGVDIGGTTVKIGLFTTDGVMKEKWEIPTRTENDGEQILPAALGTAEGFYTVASTVADLLGTKKKPPLGKSLAEKIIKTV